MVTGAASGIGRGIALRLAEMGAHVAVLDKDAEGSASTAALIQRNGGSALAKLADIHRPAEITTCG